MAELVPDGRGYLIRQFDTAWKLTTFHLDGLTTQECLWRPARQGPHVHQSSSGEWVRFDNVVLRKE